MVYFVIITNVDALVSLLAGGVEHVFARPGHRLGGGQPAQNFSAKNYLLRQLSLPTYSQT